MSLIPPFSIITAVKNRLNDLKHTYESLRKQTNQNFEWIVVDGDSTDGTSEWLSSISSVGYRIIWISELDTGISDAWNKGLALSNGNQIFILNAGDLYDSNLIDKFFCSISPFHITCCHTQLLDANGKAFGIYKADPKKLWRGMHLPHNWCCVPRVIYDQFGGYKIMQHSMDFEWFHRYYLARGLKGFNLLNEVLGSYRMGGHSDINYKQSFKINCEILIANGMNPYIAKLIKILYTLNHRLYNRSIF